MLEDIARIVKPKLIDILPTRDLVILNTCSTKFLKLLSEEWIWKSRTTKIPHHVKNLLGCKKSLLLVNSIHLNCASCLKYLWNYDYHTAIYLIICPCLGDNSYFRVHYNCIEISSIDGVEYTFCPYCGNKSLVAKISITS